MIKYFKLASFILLISSRSVFSEPTPNVNYLMNEKTSLFDFGMFKVEEILSLLFDGEDSVVSVDYNWESNRIKILVVSVDGSEARNKNEAKRRCRNAISSIRRMLYINLFRKKRSRFPDLFSHAGYKLKEDPKDLYAELENITELSGIFSFVSKTGYKNRGNVSCEGPLRGEKILFQE